MGVEFLCNSALVAADKKYYKFRVVIIPGKPSLSKKPKRRLLQRSSTGHSCVYLSRLAPLEPSARPSGRVKSFLKVEAIKTAEIIISLGEKYLHDAS